MYEMSEASLLPVQVCDTVPLHFPNPYRILNHARIECRSKYWRKIFRTKADFQRLCEKCKYSAIVQKNCLCYNFGLWSVTKAKIITSLNSIARSVLNLNKKTIHANKLHYSTIISVNGVEEDIPYFIMLLSPVYKIIRPSSYDHCQQHKVCTDNWLQASND